MWSLPLEHGERWKAVSVSIILRRTRCKNIGPLLRALCYFLLLAKRRSEDEKQLSLLSYHDMLTSFYNRNRYMKDVEALTRHTHPVGIIYLDVNGLKKISMTATAMLSAIRFSPNVQSG